MTAGVLRGTDRTDASFTPGEYTAHELDSYGYYAKYYGWMNGAELGSSAQASADQDAELQSGDLYVLEYGVAARPTVPDDFYPASALPRQLLRPLDDLGRSGGHLCPGRSVRSGGGAAGAPAGGPGRRCPRPCGQTGCIPRCGCCWPVLPSPCWHDVIAKCSDPLVSWYYYDSLWPGDRLYTLCLMGLAAAITAIFLTAALLMQTTAVRAKTHTLVRSTLILRALAWALGGIRTALLSLPVTWKAIVLFLAYTCLQLHRLYRRGAV